MLGHKFGGCVGGSRHRGLSCLLTFCASGLIVRGARDDGQNSCVRNLGGGDGNMWFWGQKEWLGARKIRF